MQSQVILIVDDDPAIGNLEQEILEQAGYTCLRAYSGTEALMLLERQRPSLILLDLMLPGLCGEQVMEKIRGIPVIIVSAKLDVDDKVSMLMSGAADYITKPFQTKELIARVAVQLRTASTIDRAPLQFGDVIVDPLSRSVNIDNRPVQLTRTEFAILKLLMQNPEQVIPKAVLLDRISADTPDCTESSLKTHISHLRAKLRDAGGRDYIESVWGIGFKMTDP